MGRARRTAHGWHGVRLGCGPPPPQLHCDSPPATLRPDGRVRAAAVNLSTIMSPDALSTTSQDELLTRHFGALLGGLLKLFMPVAA